MPIKIPKLLVSLGLCLGAGFLGTFFTISAIPTWYATLEKPIFSPPNSVFGPVWTLLYILMAISLYIVWVSKDKLKTQALRMFWIQLTLNAAWSIVFFGLHSPGLALLNILALWLAIFSTIKHFYPISKLAAYLLVPYLVWVSFATLLNFSIWILNW